MPFRDYQQRAVLMGGGPNRAEWERVSKRLGASEEQRQRQGPDGGGTEREA